MYKFYSNNHLHRLVTRDVNEPSILRMLKFSKIQVHISCTIILADSGVFKPTDMSLHNETIHRHYE